MIIVDHMNVAFLSSNPELNWGVLDCGRGIGIGNENEGYRDGDDMKSQGTGIV